jgi:hypothetical protein
MPICTYLSNQEYDMFKLVTDKELNELFQEIRIIRPEFLLEEHNIAIYTRYFFRKVSTETYYTLYNDLGSGEVQIINFESGTKVKSEIIYAYFYGILAGAKKNDSKN